MRALLVFALLASTQDKPLSIEAEDGKTVKVGKLEWVKVTKPDGYSGTGAMQAMPNDNLLHEEDYVEKSQESRSTLHRSVRPYREPTSPIRPHLAPTSPGANGSITSPIRPPLKGEGRGANPTEAAA